MEIEQYEQALEAALKELEAWKSESLNEGLNNAIKEACEIARDYIHEAQTIAPIVGWMPIADAPIMGDEILIRDDDGNRVVAFWDVHPNRSIYETDTDEEAQEKYTWAMANGSKYFYAVEFEPTHWRHVDRP